MPTRHVCDDGCAHGGLSRTFDGAGPLLADELLHVMRRPAQAARATKANTARMIRRHASWEHKMLGDVDPATLEIISAGRDVAAEDKKRSSMFKKTRDSAQTVQDDQGHAIDMDTVLHTIDQEIRRLKLFQSNPPTGNVRAATDALELLDSTARKGQIDPSVQGPQRLQKEQEIDDAKWGVRLVSLTLANGDSFLVTYGEMNTLADFYGSPAEIARTDPANFKGVVGGVREESTRKFMRLRNELAVGREKAYEPDSKAHDFAGAIGNKGTTNGAGALGAVLTADQFGELKLMGEVGDEARAELPGQSETSYTAGLVRNACHFAPQSWHAWAAAHNKALALADQAWAKNRKADGLDAQVLRLRQRGLPRDLTTATRNEQTRNALRAEADALLNSALIENGFGDHFLQDSYAAGHLINKTLIMQWFATWLDANRAKRDYTWQADWRQIQQTAYGQEGAAGRDLYTAPIGASASNDPQSVENLDGDWTARFAAIGLQIPSVLQHPNTPEFQLFTWWQEEAMEGRLKAADWKDLQKAGPIKNKNTLQTALKALIDAGVIYYEHYSQKDRAKGAESIGLENKAYNKDLCIKREYIPQASKAAEFRQAKSDALNGDASAYQKMAKAVTYADYHRFLNHGYLQLASNVLHDHFCANGLDVATAANDTPARIYGDNAMLGRESSKMVKYSATTSHMSRDSIYETALTGTTLHTTAAISARFPTWVRPVKAPANLSLEAWHGEGGSLHTFCFKTIFPQVSAIFSKSTAIASDKLVDKMSKDDTTVVHSGDAF